MTIHPTTDAVLEAQRAKLAELTPANTPMADQRQVAQELLWHAMFQVACLTPHINMIEIANMSRSAIVAGVKTGVAMGNHKV